MLTRLNEAAVRFFRTCNNGREAAIIALLDLPFMKRLFRYITPNALGYLRIISSFFVISLTLAQRNTAAIVVYGIGACTDLIDGPLARLTNNVTEEGKQLDAVADKVFILGPLLVIGYSTLSQFAIWMIIFMEALLMVTSNILKPYLRSKRNIPLRTGSNAFGQTKMVAQSIAVGLMIIGSKYSECVAVAEIIIWIAIGFSIGSFLRHLAAMDAPVAPEKRIVTVPNLVTFSAILLFPPTIVALAQGNQLLAIGFLSYIFVSDWIDGWIARRFNQITNFGKVIDPIRDSAGRLLVLIWFLIVVKSSFIHALCISIMAVEISLWSVNYRTARLCKTVDLVTRSGKIRALVHGVVASVMLAGTFSLVVLPSWAYDLGLLLMLISSIAALMAYVGQYARMTHTHVR